MLSWIDAAEKVLNEEKKALHYNDITQLILNRKLRTSSGATPANTLNRDLNEDIKNLKEKSKFAKVGRGEFILRIFVDDKTQLLGIVESFEKEKKQKEQNLEAGKILNAFGIYWDRSSVYWKTSPDFWGIQQIGADKVNFKDQRGIYLLHDNRETIYVGQAIDQTLGQRLRQHTIDRLGGRWNRFSWFGFYSVNNDGSLIPATKFENISIQDLGDVLEAILIESIEPRQNRKQGNTFSGIEYLQHEDPEIKKIKKVELIKELTDKL